MGKVASLVHLQISFVFVVCITLNGKSDASLLSGRLIVVTIELPTYDGCGLVLWDICRFAVSFFIAYFTFPLFTVWLCSHIIIDVMMKDNFDGHSKIACLIKWSGHWLCFA